MLCILTEDSTAGFQFWQAINRVYFGGKAKVISSFGINNMPKLIRNVTLDMSTKDGDHCIIVSIDSITVPSVSATLNLIKTIPNMYKDIEMYRVKQFSFEEIFLSFDKLDKWCKPEDEYYKKIAGKYREDLRNRVPPFEPENMDLELMLKKHPRAELREPFLKALLQEVTTNRKLGFKIDSSFIGNCWDMNCKLTSKDLEVGKVKGMKTKRLRRMDYMCNYCCLGKHKPSVQYKINEVVVNSILGWRGFKPLEYRRYIEKPKTTET